MIWEIHLGVFVFDNFTKERRWGQHFGRLSGGGGLRGAFLCFYVKIHVLNKIISQEYFMVISSLDIIFQTFRYKI